MSVINIFTDGACGSHDKFGGFGAVVKHNDGIDVVYGGDSETTSNKMELMGVIAGLEYGLAFAREQDAEEIRLYTDSKYVQQGITQWIHGWKKNGWKTSTKDDVKNRYEWEWLDDITSQINNLVKLNFEWVKGHNGHKGNELADSVAVQAKDKSKKQYRHVGRWHHSKKHS